MKNPPMEFTDTHTHLYDRAFEQDIDQVVARALEAGVRRMFLPNEDSASLPALKALEARYPEYFRCMVGVHPTSITADNLAHELAFVEQQLAQGGYIGIGEIGMDLYWDTTYRNAQQEAFTAQLSLALRYDLPVSIHCREAMAPTLDLLAAFPGVRGVMHCFSGTYSDARRVLDAGLALGVGGTVTYKNNPLKDVLRQTGYRHLVLETDAPFLSPVPHRGRRNESAYIPEVAGFLAQLFAVSPSEIARATQRSVREVFGEQAVN